MSSSRRAVKIRNPLGGPGWTSTKKAIKYLKRGTARLVGENEIEFIASDCRVMSAERTTTVEMPGPGLPPSHGPALTVVLYQPGNWPSAGCDLRTFAPYPIRWEGYCKAA